jgi:hypothetical protein
MKSIQRTISALSTNIHQLHLPDDDDDDDDMPEYEDGADASNHSNQALTRHAKKKGKTPES